MKLDVISYHIINHHNAQIVYKSQLLSKFFKIVLTSFYVLNHSLVTELRRTYYSTIVICEFFFYRYIHYHHKYSIMMSGHSCISIHLVAPLSCQ